MCGEPSAGLGMGTGGTGPMWWGAQHRAWRGGHRPVLNQRKGYEPLGIPVSTAGPGSTRLKILEGWRGGRAHSCTHNLSSGDLPLGSVVRVLLGQGLAPPKLRAFLYCPHTHQCPCSLGTAPHRIVSLVHGELLPRLHNPGLRGQGQLCGSPKHWWPSVGSGDSKGGALPDVSP